MLRINIFLIILLGGMFADKVKSISSEDLMIKTLREPKNLELITIDILGRMIRQYDVTCVTILCDEIYLNVFDGGFFKRTWPVPVIIVVVAEYEDLLSPNFDTLESLREAKKDGCNVYIILLANGLQVSRLLKFGDRHRVLDTRAKYVMLHDFRLFQSDVHYIWKRIVNVLFLRYHKKDNDTSWFDISTVPFPNPIKEIFVTRRVDIWKNGRFHYNKRLFSDKTRNLKGEQLNVVYLDHVPSVLVVKSNDTEKIGGVESEILNTLAEKMNFKPKLHQPVNSELHRWGQRQSNGSYSGLLGEILNGRADVALGNLQYTTFHLELLDLSIPYTSQCWTFLTPEALTDNSWKTLILPFKLYMWIAILLVLLVTAGMFYGLARFYMSLLAYKDITAESSINDISQENSSENPTNQIRYDVNPVGLFLFGEKVNSVLYTYSMSLLVSLPKLPTGSAIRLMTGWYWLYCILLVVSYKASLTAILANPAPRVTIDTLRELVDSKIAWGGWGIATKKFFEESLDEVVGKIGQKFESINDPDEAASKVAQGVFAYYENEYFLKYLSVKQKNVFIKVETDNSTINITEPAEKSNDERNLHIMSDCVINSPISIGFHKNSPIKPLADQYIRRTIEVGLVHKWLNDAMQTIRSLEREEKEVKALMNLKKLYGAFTALGIGYILSCICLIGEFLYWHFVVEKDPNFDKYALDVYYNIKNKK